MSTDERRPVAPREPDPNASPFEIWPIAGMPFAKDSEEAKAIERIIAQAERERAETAVHEKA
jgi:hypothetical protein